MSVKIGIDFWSSTPRKTGAMIREWSRLEELQGRAQAERTAYASIMMQNGKVPTWSEESKVTVDNDAILGWM